MFCTELSRAGVPVNVIKELAGHKSIETTLRYMHTDRAAKRGAIDALLIHVAPTYVSIMRCSDRWRQR